MRIRAIPIRESTDSLIQIEYDKGMKPVSYTHLTLPTICSV